MKYALTIVLASFVCLAAVDQTQAGSLKNRIAARMAQTYSWHGDYYDVAWGMPVALVVPPTAENQTKMRWGVSSTRLVPIEHQFQRNYPGPGTYQRSRFLPTPQWPSDTDQFGDYYIRGPW
ncbi:MAG: hypothetical protein ACWGMZ_11810 [Thermoguttaceae bacterium]